MPKHFDSKGKKRKKNFYVQYQKKPKINTLDSGTQGFLLTCNGDERRCIREAYNILNEFAEVSSDPKEVQEDEVSGTPTETEDELERELKALKEGEGPQARKFQQLYTGVKSCLFIQTKLDPCSLLMKILEDIRSTGKQRTVSTQKVFPVLATCKSHLDNLRKSLKDVIDHIVQDKDLYQTDDKLQYAVLFKSRHNNSLKKEDVVTTVIDMVRSEGIAWEPEPRMPDCAISIDLLSTVCCISVLPHFKKYKRYNLVELAKTDLSKDCDSKEADDDADRSVVQSSEVQQTGDKEETEEQDNSVARKTDDNGDSAVVQSSEAQSQETGDKEKVQEQESKPV